jgi:hypothetical protein
VQINSAIREVWQVHPNTDSVYRERVNASVTGRTGRESSEQRLARSHASRVASIASKSSARAISPHPCHKGSPSPAALLAQRLDGSSFPSGNKRSAALRGTVQSVYTHQTIHVTRSNAKNNTSDEIGNFRRTLQLRRFRVVWDPNRAGALLNEESRRPCEGLPARSRKLERSAEDGCSSIRALCATVRAKSISFFS